MTLPLTNGVFTMLVNNSPWIAQLKRARASDRLQADIETDVAVVGGGIAGVATAYYILKNTNQNVVILEGRKLAHGATGHNAGQVVSYFERSFSSIVSEYGLTKAVQAQSLVEDAWVLLEEIFKEAQLTLPFSQFNGFAGLSRREQLLRFLEDNRLKRKGGLVPEHIFIAEEMVKNLKLPHIYNQFYSILPHRDVLALLESKNPSYIAALSGRKGCLNSALFCEELVGFLLAKYKKRFRLFEHSKVDSIHLHEGFAMLRVDTNFVNAKHVVLCTNGFEQFTLLNWAGKQLNHQFHDSVKGVVGFMVGFFTEVSRPATAISYFPKEAVHAEDGYFYFTRRVYENSNGESRNLICIGGPEKVLDDKAHYHRYEQDHPDTAITAINEFLERDVANVPAVLNHEFRWHGLMGYTPNLLRVVGPDPVNSVLLYNLGCNGVGILPSVMGGNKISRHIGGQKMSPTIFDPKR
ncbi:MAG TPA: FAD-binding oxidoreductase [Patescibacteria group bacterium]|nr:FAD-binding oxidoreductase [Patescibacteria group bacterium]